MTIKGTPRSYFKAFKFLVEIDGVEVARFAKCSKLEAEIAVIEQFEGGDITADKSPGRVKFSDLTLERGATKDQDLWNWFKEVVNVAANGGLVDAKYKRNLDIVAQDRDNTTLRRYRVYQAFPTKRSVGDWDDKDENLMESVTLAYRYYEEINPLAGSRRGSQNAPGAFCPGGILACGDCIHSLACAYGVHRGCVPVGSCGSGSCVEGP